MKEQITPMHTLPFAVEVIKYYDTGDLYQITNQMLNLGIQNDVVFENFGFYMRVVFDKPTDVLYRMMWEDLYLRKTKRSQYVTADRMILRISLSEALEYICDATPPILRPRIPQATRSVDNVHSLLNSFLVETEDSQHEYHLSLFKKKMRLEPFETAWSYDTRKIDMMTKMHPDKQMVCVIDAMTYPIDRLVKHDTQDPSTFADVMAQITFHINGMPSHDTMRMLTGFLQNTAYVTNIKPTETGIYVTTFIQNPNNELVKFISEIYGSIIK